MAQKLAWDEIRQQYPKTFVLLDNCEELREQNKVIVYRGEVILASNDSKAIYDEYCKRGQPPHMTFGHTNWKQLEMEEISFLGLRPAHV